MALGVVVCLSVWNETRLQSLTAMFHEVFWLREITTDPHILAHINMELPDERSSKPKNVYLRNDFRWLPIHTSSIRNYAMHDMTLIKLAVARFVGTGSFLIRYSNGHTI
jgi:hypothetical protein